MTEKKKKLTKTYRLEDGGEVVCDFAPQVADSYRLDSMRTQLLLLNFLPEAVRMFTLSGLTFFDQQRIANSIMMWQYLDDRRRMRLAGVEFVDNDYMALKHEIYVRFQDMSQQEIEAQCNSTGAGKEAERVKEDLKEAQKVVKSLGLAKAHDPKARLALFVRNLRVPVDVDDLIERIGAAEKAQQVAFYVVKDLVDNYGMDITTATTKPFISALVPFVTFKSSNPYYSLKNAIRYLLITHSSVQGDGK